MQETVTPIRVYLDTADWAYLQEGKATAAEAILRQLATDAKVVFFISEDHLIEISGLTDGREERLTFIWSFPGTLLLQCSTHEILGREAWRFVEIAEGREAPPTSTEAKPLQGFSLAELMGELDSLKTIRDGYYYGAEIIHRGRSMSGERRGADVRTSERMLHDFVSGDAKAVVRQLIHMGQAPDQDQDALQARLQVAMDALQAEGLGGVLRVVDEQLQGSGHETVGIPSLADTLGGFGQLDPKLLLLDPVFRRAILPHLPDAVTQDQTRLSCIARAWQKAETQSAVPSLVAYAALVRDLHFQPQRKYEGSEELDRRHVVYSTLANVFTCDQRNEGPLRKALSTFDWGPKIVRTHDLGRLSKELLADTQRKSGEP